MRKTTVLQLVTMYGYLIHLSVFIKATIWLTCGIYYILWEEYFKLVPRMKSRRRLGKISKFTKGLQKSLRINKARLIATNTFGKDKKKCANCWRDVWLLVRSWQDKKILCVDDWFFWSWILFSWTKYVPLKIIVFQWHL